jgi:hypothetical protein
MTNKFKSIERGKEMKHDNIIYETMKYGMFVMLPTNRDVKRIEVLRKLMKEYGFRKAYPLYCVEMPNRKLKIIDGHHRFEVARELGIPVKYVIDDVEMPVYDIAKAARFWDLEDYLTSECRGGNVDYVKIKKFHDETGIGLNQTVSMFAGQQASSFGNVKDRFKDGEFVCKEAPGVETVKNIVLFMKSLGMKWTHHSKLVNALSRIVFVKEFDPKVLMKKIKAHPHLVKRQVFLDDYMAMFEEIYNFRANEKVPLKFLAEQAARERNAVKK